MLDVVIIGSGCAGNTAAIYAAALTKPLVVQAIRQRTTVAHHAGGEFPRFPEGINGPDLVENMKKQAETSAPQHASALSSKPTQ
jgi:thioredoxin reductase (NADPH)